MTSREIREGTHREYDWRVNVLEDDYWRDFDRYGDTRVELLDGNHIIYSESHHLDETSIDTLEQRIKGCIDDLHDDENVEQCAACNDLYNRRVDKRLYEQELTWADRHIFKHGINPRYKAAETNDRAETCVYVTGRIFDTIHIITHHWEVNPFFTDEELVASDSLVIARGFSRAQPDGEPRDFDELQEKYMEITRATPSGRNNREKRKEMLELLDWTLKREDRFRTDRRFKHRIHR